MHNAIKKAFTGAVVASTIAWSIGLAAMPFAAKAAPVSGTLVKASLPAVYYVGADQKRYVFPNEPTYKTWYADFSGVQVITDAELAALPIGGNVTYKPGARMVKITSDPKVYAVDANGTLRWVTSEAAATALYGTNWNQMIDDVSDAFFTNYKIGADVASAADFSPAAATAAAISINSDKGLAHVADGSISASMASGVVGGNVPKGATGVTMVRVNVTNNSATAKILDTMTVKRIGYGSKDDIANAYVYEGNSRISFGRAFGSNDEITFGALNIALAAYETKTLSIVVDIAASPSVGNEDAVQVIGLTSGATAAAGLPVAGPTFRMAGVQVGGLTIDKVTVPSTVKAGETGAKVASFSLVVNNDEDAMINRIALLYTGSTSRSNLSNLTLKRGSATLATVAGINAKDQAVFALSTPFFMEKGETRTFDVYADIAGAARGDETVKFYMEEKSDIAAVGQTYGYGLIITNSYGSSNGNSVTIESGDLNIAFNGPASKDIAQDSKDVELFSFTMTAQANLEVRRVNLDVVTTTNLDDLKLVDAATGVIVAGALDGVASGVKILEGVFNLAAGQSRTFKVTADIAKTATGNTKVGLADFGANDIRNLDNSKYLVPADNIVPSKGTISGNEHAIVAAGMTVSKASTPVSQTYIKGTQGAETLGIVFKADAAADMKVLTVPVTFALDVTTVAVRDVVTTASLWDGSVQIGSSRSPDTDGKVEFSNLDYLVMAGASKTLTVKVNLSNLVEGTRTLTAKVLTNTVRYSKADGTGEATSTAAFDGNGMQIKQAGSLVVAMAPVDAETEEGLVIGGSTNVVLAKYRLTAVDEALQLTKAKFEVATATGASSLSLYDGATLVGGPVSVGSDKMAAFTGLSMEIPKDGTKTLTVKANLTSVSASGVATGSSVKVTLKDSDFEARGISVGSNTKITSISGDKAGLEKIVHKTKPTVSLVSLPTTYLSDGEMTILKFSVAADAAGDVALGQVKFNVALNGVTFATDSSIVLRTASGTKLGEVAAAAGDKVIKVTEIADGFVIAAGSSQILEIIGTITGAASDDSIVSRLLDGAASTAKGTLTAMTGAHGFVWSDMSTVIRTASEDWINGYKIKNLPTSTQTITR